MSGLERRRREAGLTIVKLAEKSGVSAPTIIKIEAGRIESVRLGILLKLANALNCSVLDFL